MKKGDTEILAQVFGRAAIAFAVIFATAWLYRSGLVLAAVPMIAIICWHEALNARMRMELERLRS